MLKIIEFTLTFKVYCIKILCSRKAMSFNFFYATLIENIILD